MRALPRKHCVCTVLFPRFLVGLNCRIPGPAICISLNENSSYCYIPRSSKHTYTCKWLGRVFCNRSLFHQLPLLCALNLGFRNIQYVFAIVLCLTRSLYFTLYYSVTFLLLLLQCLCSTIPSVPVIFARFFLDLYYLTLCSPCFAFSSHMFL